MNSRPLFSESDEVLAVRLYYPVGDAAVAAHTKLQGAGDVWDNVRQIGLQLLTCDGHRAPTARREDDGGTLYTAYRFYDDQGNEYESRQGGLQAVRGAYEFRHKEDWDVYPQDPVFKSLIAVEYAIYELLKRLQEGGGIERIGNTLRLLKMLTKELWEEKQLRVLLKHPQRPVLHSNVQVVSQDSSWTKSLDFMWLDAIT